MIARGKRRLAAAVLAVFTAWPFVHIGLVHAYDLNPWKFGGWAMYTTAVLEPKVEIFVLREDERELLGVGAHAYPKTRAAHDQLMFDLAFWGELVDTDPLAAAAREETGTDATIEIAITRHFVDRQSSRVSARRDSHFYEAPR